MDKETIFAVSILASSVILYPIVKYIVAMFLSHKVSAMVISIFITLSILALSSPQKLITIVAFWETFIIFALTERNNEHLIVKKDSSL